MNRTQLNTSRLVIGLLLVMTATLLFVFGGEAVATAGVVALLVLGLISIAIARRG
jgi:hypothetical protein